MIHLNTIQEVTDLADCSNCGLISENMRQRVMGKGARGGIMIIGEAPGEDDVRLKEGFTGYSGRLLRLVMKEAGIDPKDCWFSNTCLCRPPGNRTPSPNEVRCCNNRLQAEIDFVKPTKILALGNTISESLFGIGNTMTKIQGGYKFYKGIPVMPCYHPAFVLRSPENFTDLAFCVEKLKRDPQNYLFPLEADGYPRVPYTLLAHNHEVEFFLKYIGNSFGDMFGDMLTVDIETGDKITGYKLLALGMFFQDRAYIVPGEIFHDSPYIRGLFEGRINLPSLSTNSQNGVYERQQFRKRYDINFPIDNDTMLQHFTLDERSGDDDSGGKGGSYHGLDTLARLYLDAPNWKGLMAPYKEDYGLAPKDVLYRYLALDLCTEHLLAGTLTSLQEKEGNVSLGKDFLFPHAETLADIELNGSLIDKEYFKSLSKDYDADIKKMTQDLRDTTGMPTLNPGSYKQVGELIFNRLGLPRIKKDSTDKHVMEQLTRKFPQHKVLKQIAAIRSKRTIQSTFIEGIPKLADSDGWVFTRFLLHGTPTGRLASRGPNLQNIPSRVGPEIRNGFIAAEGWDLLNLDYKQLEFRVLAYLSMDQALINFILSGRDIHSEVAAEFFDIPYGTETEVQRLDAKTFVFGVPYGRTPEGIAKAFDIPLSEARRRHSVLKGMFPDAYVWIAEMQEKALLDGYVDVYAGHKRRFPFITSRNRDDVKNQAANAPIQGLASHICLMATRRSQSLLDPSQARTQILVHDSHMLRTKSEHTLNVARVVKAEMEKDPFPTPIPFLVDVKVGKRWGELEKIRV